MKAADVQSTLRTAIAAIPALSGVTVLIEDGAADNDGPALDQLNTHKGVAIIVQRIARMDAETQDRPAHARVIVPVTLQEKVERNRGEDGTGKTALELCDAMIGAVLNFRDAGPPAFSLAPTPIVNLGAEKGLEEYVITFRARVTYV